MSHPPGHRRHARIAAALLLMLAYGLAFHYAKQYEGEMLTDQYDSLGRLQ